MNFIILGTLLGASYFIEPERLIILLGFLEEIFVFFLMGQWIGTNLNSSFGYLCAEIEKAETFILINVHKVNIIHNVEKVL